MNNTKEVRGIAEVKDYGKVEIKLSSIMDKHNISIYQMTKLTGLKHTTVKAYYTNSPMTRVDLDVIAKLCYVLDCKIEDIIEYVPSAM
jgi:putative transcriptional regulator